MRTTVTVTNAFYEVHQDNSLIAAGHSLGYSPAKIADMHGFDPRKVELVGEATEPSIYPIFADHGRTI